MWGGVVVYFAVGVVYYSYATQLGIIDSIYFTAQTVTTVGAPQGCQAAHQQCPRA